MISYESSESCVELIYFRRKVLPTCLYSSSIVLYPQTWPITVFSLCLLFSLLVSSVIAGFRTLQPAINLDGRVPEDVCREQLKRHYVTATRSPCINCMMLQGTWTEANVT